MRIFISRLLKENSVLRQTLEEQGHEVIGQSLLQFVALPFSPPPLADWIFAYSPRGIRFFLDGLRQKDVTLPPHQAFAAIGPGTAAAMQEMGLSVSFTGNGVAGPSAKAFLAVARNKKVIFPQAQDSRRSIEKALGNRIQAFPLVVYKSMACTSFSIPPADVLVFTSPRNTQSYYERYAPQPHQHIVAIGEPTADTLRALHIPNVQMAEEPSEASLLKAVLQLF